MKRLKTNTNSSFNTMNESIDWTKWRENFPLLLTTFNFFSVPLFSFLGASVSPFYIYVNKKNQLIDRKSVIFPVAVHSYSLLVKLIWLEYVSALTLLAATYFYVQKITQLLAIFFLITMSSFLAQDVLIQVQHILLFVQASQRFLLYFIPKLENHLNISLITTKRFVYILCILISVKDTVLLVLLCKMIASDDDRKLDNDYVLLFRKSFYLLLNTLLFIVCILYIPMFISIWRLRHLRSVVLFRPQKYVFYQVLSIVSAKIVTTLLLGAHLAAAWIYLKMHSIEYPEAFLFFQEHSFDIVTYYFFYDCSLIPFVIQLTYLFCNKRNVDTLLSSPVGRAMKFIFCQNRGLSQVEPGVWTTDNQTV